MFGTRWRLFRLLGVPVSIDASWLIILALLTLSLAHTFPGLLTTYYPAISSGASPEVYWLMGLVAAVVFFGCILLHELGHAIVARIQRISVRGITLFVFGGVAEIDEPPSARAELLVAIAGPIVSVFLAAALGGLAWLGYQLAWPPSAVIVLGYLATINGVVLVFNLIPAFPLDGGRVLRSILWNWTGNLRQATYWSTRVGRVFGTIFIAWGVLNFFAGNWLGGIWIGMIGMFLNSAAEASYQQVVTQQALKGRSVLSLMSSEPVTVPPFVDLQQWVEEYVFRYHHKAFPVASNSHLEGMIETQSLASVARDAWHRHTVGEVMRRDLTGITIPPHTDALEALTRMQRSGSSRLLVTEGDRLIGIITLTDFLRFLSLKDEIAGFDGSSPATTRPQHATGHIYSDNFAGKS